MTSFARSEKAPGGSSVRDEAFEIRGTSFPLTVIRLRSPDPVRLRAELEEKVGRAGDYFRNCPAVLDLQPVEATLAPAALPSLFALLRELAFVPLGVCNGTPDQRAASLEAGLALLQSPSRTKPGATTREAAEPRDVSPPPRAAEVPREVTPALAPAVPASEPSQADPRPPKKAAKVVSQPVRSGQRIYARGSDLVVVGAVNAGAEVIADGNVHVYGALRGRALAGAGGDGEARIFCQSLEAELVSIAGTYRVIEDVPAPVRGKPAQVYISNDHLVIAPLF
jgi:septum site-determining protein MinC